MEISIWGAEGESAGVILRDMEFGDRVRVVRQERGLSQAELADRVRRYLDDSKIGIEHVSRLERNHHEPRASLVRALATALDTTADFLLGLTDDAGVPDVARYPVPLRILSAFSVEEGKKLVAACTTARDTALVLTLLDTGLRAAELCTLTVGRVDMATGALSVRQGKGRKDRTVYIGQRTRLALRRYLRRRTATPDEPLFLSRRGKALTVNGLLQLCRRLGRRAGVDHCHPHTFRRTFALWSLRAGMDIYSLQRLMGHSDLAMLRQYLAFVQTDIARAHAQHGAVAAML